MGISSKTLVLAMSVLVLASCSAKKSGSVDLSCNTEYCISSFCPDYVAIEPSSSEITSTPCPLAGSCEIPNMPLTFQLGIGIPGGSIACGPTSTQMIVNSVLANSNTQLYGWISDYSAITPKIGRASCRERV